MHVEQNYYYVLATVTTKLAQITMGNGYVKYVGLHQELALINFQLSFLQMNRDVALSKLTEIFPERENLSLIVDECRTLLNNQIDLDQAIAAICQMDEGMKIWIMAIHIGLYVIATLSVYPHRASLKNMSGHGGIRTYDLWNASPMLCKLSYAVRSVRVYDISELSLVPSIPM